MPRSSAEWDWGSWVLGDMADCLRRAAELLGGTFQPARVSAAPPEEGEELPRVVVTVSDEHTSIRLRRSLESSASAVRFLRPSTSCLWRCQVEDLDLTVSVETEDETGPAPW